MTIGEDRGTRLKSLACQRAFRASCLGFHSSFVIRHSSFFIGLLCAAAPAADWPQWRGPQRNGISSEQVSPWPADGPKVLWHASVGTGFSSFSVSSGRAYTMGNSNDEDTVWCFDAASGNLIWKHSYPAQLGAVYYEGGPGSTPTIASNRVYTIGKWGAVFCLDAANGSVVWRRDLAQDGIKSNRWGFAGSPLMWNDLVILNAGSFGTALEAGTGRLVWQTGPNPTGYASPTLFNSDGKEAVLIFAAKHLVAVDPRTGHELWRHPWETGWDTNNPDPLVQDDKIFISSFSRGCALLSVAKGHPQVVYDNKALFNHLCSGIIQGEYLYAFNGEATRDTDLRCLHRPTGEVKWTRRDPAFGSMICAGGKLIILSERGELLLGDASPSGFQPLARAQALAGRCWTPPALANGRLYLRNAKGEVVCLEIGRGVG